MVLLVYRTGVITSLFFEELANILDSVATYSSPFLVAGDLNIHVEHENDLNAQKLKDLFSLNLRNVMSS